MVAPTGWPSDPESVDETIAALPYVMLAQSRPRKSKIMTESGGLTFLALPVLLLPAVLAAFD